MRRTEPTAAGGDFLVTLDPEARNAAARNLLDRTPYALFCVKRRIVQIDAPGVEARLAGLRADLVSKTYGPDSGAARDHPEAEGGERPLGIATIGDRVVQAAAKIALEPIWH